MSLWDLRKPEMEMTNSYRETKLEVKQRNVGKVTATIYYKSNNDSNIHFSVHDFIGYVEYICDKYSSNIYDHSRSAKDLFISWRDDCTKTGWVTVKDEISKYRVKHTPISNINHIICDEQDYFVDDVNPFK